VSAWVEGLRVVDVHDPPQPREVDALDGTILQGTADRVAVGGNHLYLTLQEGGLMVLDLADPGHPRPFGTYAPPAGAMWGVSPADGYVYATGTTSEGDERRGMLYVIDVADATRPSQAAAIELPQNTSSSVTVAGDYAYVTLADCQYFSCSGSLQLIDAADPTQPRLVSSLDVPGGAFTLATTDSTGGNRRYAYLAAGDDGVHVVDVSDPTQPRLVGQADTPGRARDIAVVDDFVYVGDGSGGFLVLRVARATSSPGPAAPTS
jgi:hypothetical protein